MRRLLLAIPAVALAGLVLAPAAWGHAAFVGSTPEPGQRLEASPQELSLTFTEPLIEDLSRATLVAETDDREVPARVGITAQRRMTVIPLDPLPRGAYRVQWRSVSPLDGHALEGTVSFGVRAAAVGGADSLEQSPLARQGWIRVVARLALYAFGLTFAAALLLALVLGGRGWLAPRAVDDAVDGPAVRARQQRLTGDLAWLTVGAAVATVLAEAIDAADGLDPAGISVYLLDSPAGVARTAVVALALVAALTWRRLPRTGAALIVLALGAIAASGHAASATPRLAAIANDWLHLVGGALWLGGMAFLAAVWGPSLRRGGDGVRPAVARHVLPAFGRVALPAFVLVAGTGLVSLVLQLGSPSALWTTDYGRLLGLKIVVVGLIALASAVHALRLRPRLLAVHPPPRERDVRRHWRLVRFEPAMALGVVAAVALLVAFPLSPSQLGEARDAQAASPCDPCPLPRPAADQLAVAADAGMQLVGAWSSRDGGRLSGEVRVLGPDGKPSQAPFRVLGARTEPCGPACLRFSMRATDALAVAVDEPGRSHRVELPTRWEQGADARARRMLERAQRAMRDLDTAVERESTSSGIGPGARTTYRIQAPDRMAWSTDRGIGTVVIGDRQWRRAPGLGPGWQEGSYGGGLAFRTRTWFRWTPFARSIRLLGVERVDGRRLARLALFDEGTPVWMRIDVDLETDRVLRVRSLTPSTFTTTTLSDFDVPLDIVAPEEAPDGR